MSLARQKTVASATAVGVLAAVTLSCWALWKTREKRRSARLSRIQQALKEGATGKVCMTSYDIVATCTFRLTAMGCDLRCCDSWIGTPEGTCIARGLCQRSGSVARSFTQGFPKRRYSQPMSFVFASHPASIADGRGERIRSVWRTHR